MKVRKKFGLAKKLFGVFIIVVIFTTIMNYQVVFDFVRGVFYSPSVEMIEIRDNLDLTQRGALIFNASRPELNDANSFNQNCYSYNEEEAILGCYTKQNIYIYYIRSDELEGILEVTAAHELLHAVYERMSVGERDSFKDLLEKVYADNREILEEEINNYDTAEQLEEIYVRAGTEIKNLPEELENHYAEIFKNQDKIVSFYDRYIKIFRGIEKELKALEIEMKDLEEQINMKISEYEEGVNNLNRDIEEFNNCAYTVGCFNSNSEFNIRKNDLIARQNVLRGLYGNIDELINKYNIDVEKYNNNIVRRENLQNLINSHVKIEGL